MPKRQKCGSCSTGWCKNHLFQLKPLFNTLFFRKIQKVRLCPRYNKSIQNFQASVPQANIDRKYYTPSFILQEQKSFYLENDKKMLRNHEEKIQQMVQGATGSIVIYLKLWSQSLFLFYSIIFQLVAKHGRKRKYCTVCYSEYQDYLEHIKLVSHKEKINKSKYTGFIRQLAAQYQKKRALQKKPYNIQQTADCIANSIANSNIQKSRKIEKIPQVDVDNFEQQELKFIRDINRMNFRIIQLKDSKQSLKGVTPPKLIKQCCQLYNCRIYCFIWQNVSDKTNIFQNIMKLNHFFLLE